jgi:hypothetical protein
VQGQLLAAAATKDRPVLHDILAFVSAVHLNGAPVSRAAAESWPPGWRKAVDIVCTHAEMEATVHNGLLERAADRPLSRARTLRV